MPTLIIILYHLLNKCINFQNPQKLMVVGRSGVNGVLVQLRVVEGTECDLGLVTGLYLPMVVPIVQMTSHLNR